MATKNGSYKSDARPTSNSGGTISPLKSNPGMQLTPKKVPVVAQIKPMKAPFRAPSTTMGRSGNVRPEGRSYKSGGKG